MLSRLQKGPKAAYKAALCGMKQMTCHQGRNAISECYQKIIENHGKWEQASYKSCATPPT